MSEWKEIELGQVADVRGGKRLPKGEALSQFPTNHPYIRTRDIANHKIKINELLFVPDDIFSSISNYTVEENDLIISIVGTIGLCAVIPKELHLASLTENCAKIVNINNKQINRTFLFYYLISEEGQAEIESRSVGSTQPKLPLYNIKSIKIPVPPLPEQRAIASVLSSLDDKIDLLHRENKTLEAMAETLFRQWFIEEAKDEWEEKVLKDIYIFEKGFEPGSANYLEAEERDTIRFIRVGDMLSYTPSVYIKKSLTESTCTADDLLMSFDGTPGRLNFGIEGAYSSGIRKIYSLNPLYDNLGLKFLVFKSKDIQDMINAHASGTVILHASSSIDDLTFSFPDEKKLDEFNKLISPIFSKIQFNKKQIHTLEKLRDTLLPKLMSGEVRVKYEEEEMASCRA